MKEMTDRDLARQAHLLARVNSSSRVTYLATTLTLFMAVFVLLSSGPFAALAFLGMLASGIITGVVGSQHVTDHVNYDKFIEPFKLDEQ